jgi:predicted PurR-regulated permease PerM
MTPRNALGLSRPGQAVLRAGVVSWSLVGLALVTFGVWKILGQLRPAVIVMAVAVLIVLILEPAVTRLQRLRLPRWASVLIVYFAVLFPLGFALWWLGALMFFQLTSLIDRGPELLEGFGSFADSIWLRLDAAGLPMPAPDPETWLLEHRDEIIDRIISIATAAKSLTTIAFAAIAGPIVAFYILVELPRIRAGVLTVLPAHRRETVMEGFRIIGRSVGMFFRGQLLIAIAVGLLSTIGLTVLGVRYAVLIGAIAGISNLVPLFGPIVGSVPGVLIAFGDSGPWLALWVILLFVAVQQLESHVLSPLILGASMQLRPVAVVIGMLAGAAAAGLLGMILAVPVMASVSGLYGRFGPRVPPDDDEAMDREFLEEVGVEQPSEPSGD